MNQKQQPLISLNIESCESFVKNIITNSDDQKLLYEYGKYKFPSKGSLLSPQMSIGIYISLKVKIPGHCHPRWCLQQHIFIHFKHVSLMNLNQNPLSGSSSGVVVRSTGTYGRLSGHRAGPVLGWVARVEYPVPKHYTCQAVRFGFRESFSWLSIVLRMRR